MKIIVASIFAFVLLPTIVFAQTNGAEISIRQQLYSVEPTMDVRTLEQYSQGGVLSSGTVQIGLPILVLALLVLFGYAAFKRKQRLKCSKEECRRTYIRFVSIGILNAIALFIVLQLVGGLLRPASLQNLAVYVDDERRFATGDRVRVTFDISNSGNQSATDVRFRNMYSDELRVVPESILLTKDGTLSESYLPYATSMEILADIGELEPGESATITYDFIVLRGELDEIANIATLSGDNLPEIQSNTIHIRRYEETSQ